MGTGATVLSGTEGLLDVVVASVVVVDVDVDVDVVDVTEVVVWMVDVVEPSSSAGSEVSAGRNVRASSPRPRIPTPSRKAM
ncbi:MAG: hypothetical protein ABIR68_09935, partial [Ilumatobacteraceae bacterium]